MRKLIFFLLPLFFVSSLIAKPQINSSQVVVVHTADKPAILVTATNPEFKIKLKSNPTTGYSWFLQDYNSHLIQPVKRIVQPPISQLVGAFGFELWTFRLKPDAFVVPQQTVIRFNYTRPWEVQEAGTPLIFKITTQAAS